MQIHSVQHFFLGICGAAASLFLLVCSSLFFHHSTLTIPLIFFGAALEESVRVLILYSLWHRRNITHHLGALGALMGLGFGLSEVSLRILGTPISETHYSEFFGLAGITALHCLLGFLCGAVATRYIASSKSLLHASPLLLTIFLLFCLHALYNLTVVFWLSPILDKL